MNEAVYELCILQTISAVVIEKAWSNGELCSGNSAVCCNSCLIDKYLLSMQGSLEIVHYRKLKGGMILQYMEKLRAN